MKRQIDPDDARVLRISIRPDGRRCAMRLIKCFDTLEAKIEGEVGTSQVRAAIAVMSRVEELSEAVSPL